MTLRDKRITDKFVKCIDITKTPKYRLVDEEKKDSCEGCVSENLNMSLCHKCELGKIFIKY